VTHRIAVRVTASETGFASSTKTSLSTADRVIDGNFTVSGIPTIAGTLMVGHTLTATFVTSPVGSNSYRWYRNGTSISGATHKTYSLVAADLDANLTVKASAALTGYNNSASATSNPVGPVAKGTIVAGTPTFTGTLRVGHTLTGHAGTWTSSPHLHYAWYVDGSLVQLSLSSTFVLTDEYEGAFISMQVTGTRLGYDSATSVTTASQGPVNN
jgi:hypothetical protein